MSYTSDVAFSIIGKKDDILAKLTAFRLGGGPERKLAIDSCSYIERGKNIIISFEEKNTKWYESYPDVIALTALFDHFAEDEDCDEKFSCALVRIGEDLEDAETRYYGNAAGELAWVVRQVDIEYKYDKTNTLEKILCPK